MEPEPPAELAPAATAPAWVPEGLRGRPMLWLKLLSAYFSSQSLAQLLSVAAGLVLVRFLAVRELALYTLAASAVAFYGFLSDLGSTGSLLYFFQRSRRDGEDFEPYVAAVAWLRTRALALGAATVLVALPALARSRGFGLGESLLVAGAVVANVWFQMVSAIRLQLLRLSGEYGRAYRADIVSGGTRLA
nr:hypothetical protein [Thermoanaerobaculia bacterium]